MSIVQKLRDPGLEKWGARVKKYLKTVALESNKTSQAWKITEQLSKEISIFFFKRY